MKYRKYDQSIVNSIKETGNINLYPELKIPRTTALYWLKIYSYEKMKTINIKKTIQEDANYDSQPRLVGTVFVSELFDQLKNLTIDPANKRKIIIKLIEKLKLHINLNQLLKMLKISTGKYYRWRIEVIGCSNSNTTCNIVRANQITKVEQDKMIELAMSKKFAHLSVKSLAYYAQRKSILTCSYDSWRKYLRLYNVKRFKVSNKKLNFNKVGIRAKAPNELWHVDITEVIIKNNQKYYIQVIIDNFSRAIVSWKISDFKDTQLSLKTLFKAFQIGHKPIQLMSDAGCENKNSKIAKLLLGKGIKQVIALVDTLFSNSMVEAFFRIIKGYTYFFKLKSLNALKRKVGKFIDNYNNEYPHSSLHGATPMEAFNEMFDLIGFKNKLAENRVHALIDRRANYEKCLKCIA